MKDKRTRFWVAVTLFGFLFALSQDYWTWSDHPSVINFGLPRWVYTFAVLQICVSIVVAWFVAKDSTKQ